MELQLAMKVKQDYDRRWGIRCDFMLSSQDCPNGAVITGMLVAFENEINAYQALATLRNVQGATITNDQFVLSVNVQTVAEAKEIMNVVSQTLPEGELRNFIKERAEEGPLEQAWKYASEPEQLPTRRKQGRPRAKG